MSVKGQSNTVFMSLMKIISILLAFLIFGLILNGIILVFLKISIGEEVMEETVEKTYRITSFDPVTKKTETNAVTLPENLGLEEYRSYVDSDNRYNLISNFEADEYKCTTRCECEDNENNREFGIRQITFLTILSVPMSPLPNPLEATIKQECVRELRSICTVSNIKVIQQETECTKIDPTMIEEVDGWDKRDKEFCEYQCKGYCVPQNDIPYTVPENHDSSWFTEVCRKYSLEFRKTGKCYGSGGEGHMLVETREQLSHICKDFWKNFAHVADVKGSPEGGNNPVNPCFEGEYDYHNVWCHVVN